ncbi:MAG: ribosome biogenesis factor YjgA [Halioglobus sp.]|nr:ribosome biogenesis factor YjgA [Halioglobus sp.]
MPDRRENGATEPQDTPSKSARKRQMLALQTVGESLLSLNDNQLSNIPIDDERLLLAIREYRQIRSNSARKRHLQLIGKIMRNIDPAPIEQALAALHGMQRESTAKFHQLEQLREDMLAAGVEGAELAMARFPKADRQQLRQAILQHHREVQAHKPPSASRKLFRYLMALQQTHSASD